MSVDCAAEHEWDSPGIAAPVALVSPVQALISAAAGSHEYGTKPWLNILMIDRLRASLGGATPGQCQMEACTVSSRARWHGQEPTPKFCSVMLGLYTEQGLSMQPVTSLGYKQQARICQFGETSGLICARQSCTEHCDHWTGRRYSEVSFDVRTAQKQACGIKAVQ